MKHVLAIISMSALLAMNANAESAPHAATPEIANAVRADEGVISAGRLTSKDLPRLKQAGIEHVIDLTPDAETPEFDEASEVRAAGMEYSNLPLRSPADLTPQNVAAFDQLLREAKRPVVVHCASGNRVGAIAALRAAWIEGKSVEEAIAIGKQWGLKGLEPEVRKRIETTE